MSSGWHAEEDGTVWYDNPSWEESWTPLVLGGQPQAEHDTPDTFDLVGDITCVTCSWS
jgi:hypothetical protein